MKLIFKGGIQQETKSRCILLGPLSGLWASLPQTCHFCPCTRRVVWRNGAEAGGAQNSPEKWLRQWSQQSLPSQDRPWIFCPKVLGALELWSPFSELHLCFRSWLQGFKPGANYKDSGKLLTFSKEITNLFHPWPLSKQPKPGGWCCTVCETWKLPHSVPPGLLEANRLRVVYRLLLTVKMKAKVVSRSDSYLSYIWHGDHRLHVSNYLWRSLSWGTWN